jgi:Zn-dependent M16 (insulinase) family peptidase
MKPIHDPRNPDLPPHGNYRGYDVSRIAELPETGSVFYELEHRGTGARHVHISTDDRENTFGVILKTVPKDSTGVAHILEHTVLCGSDKFPVRDPFFSMLKRSLNTFMNAFTASDWTMYPFSTQNPTDYYNLMDVYLDSVFFPRIDPLSFKQEGHRLEMEKDPAAPNGFRLVYKGVVYNEMKGAMSSPDQVMARSLLKALYPATTYRHNSGGDPAEIPTLTHDQLKTFHRHHYHPSNSYFYTYGNQPLKGHLDFIEERVLSKFERLSPDTDVPPQPRWERPRQATFTYPLAESENDAKKCQICLAWLTADIRDTFEVLVLALLEQVLLGNPASPLRKALIDSRLGTALCDSAGFDADNRDTLFVCGLKGVEASSAAAIEALIFDVLNTLADKGIDETLIESAIHQIEFHRKEITNSPYPYGLKRLLTIAGTWIHGGDPIKKMLLDDDLTAIRRAVGTAPFFEQRIRRYFLENPHRVLFHLVPDRKKELKDLVQEAAALDHIKSGLTPADLDRIAADAGALQRLQEKKEDLSCLPTLRREDIPADVPRIAPTGHGDDAAVVRYAQQTSDIFYFAAAAGVGRLSGGHVPLVPFFCFALTKSGTRYHDYVETARRIDLYTGGLTLSAHSRSGFNDSTLSIPFVSVNAKCLNRNLDRMFEVVAELVLSADFSDLDRLRSLLLEYRANLEAQVVSNGHRLAISLATRNFSTARYLSETWSGVSQLRTIKALSDDLSDDGLQRLAGELADMRGALFCKDSLQAALIGEDRSLAPAEKAVRSLLSDLGDPSGPPYAGKPFDPPPANLGSDIPREGWSTSSAVSFVAEAFETVRMQHADAPALAVLSKILRSMYLHREIREKGGAYGGFSLYNPEDGLFCFASYRDPHIVATLDVYRRVGDFIGSGAITDQDVEEAILQVCSEIDKPDPPGPAARKAFYRRIISLSDEERLRFKSRLLSLNRGHVLTTAHTYLGRPGAAHAVAVISGEGQLTAANQRLAPPLEIHRI